MPLFHNAIDNVRTAAVSGLVSAGAAQADATQFVASFTPGTLLQLLISFLSNPADLTALVQFVISLFVTAGGTLTPATPPTSAATHAT